MGISRVQRCDRCGASRSLRDRQPEDDGGWLRVPVDPDLGVARPEQPTLCRDCRRQVTHEIRLHEQQVDPAT